MPCGLESAGPFPLKAHQENAIQPIVLARAAISSAAAAHRRRAACKEGRCRAEKEEQQRRDRNRRVGSPRAALHERFGGQEAPAREAAPWLRASVSTPVASVSKPGTTARRGHREIRREIASAEAIKPRAMPSSIAGGTGGRLETFAQAPKRAGERGRAHQQGRERQPDRQPADRRRRVHRAASPPRSLAVSSRLPRAKPRVIWPRAGGRSVVVASVRPPRPEQATLLSSMLNHGPDSRGRERSGAAGRPAPRTPGGRVGQIDVPPRLVGEGDEEAMGEALRPTLDAHVRAPLEVDDLGDPRRQGRECCLDRRYVGSARFGLEREQHQMAQSCGFRDTMPLDPRWRQLGTGVYADAMQGASADMRLAGPAACPPSTTPLRPRGARGGRGA